MLNNLFNIIFKTNKPDDQDKLLCEQYFEPLSGNRNSILEEQDKKPQFLYFVNTGFLRLFYYDENGDEVTTHLTSSDGFIASFLNLIHETPSTENVECITDCKLLRISRANLITLIDKSETFKKFSLIIFEQAIATTQIRANDLATLSAELRYKKLINDQPQLLQNIPIQYIASYLGIKSQSLSRIRRQIIF